MSREGIVYIAEITEEEASATATPRFRGHWEALDLPALIETGPGWSTPDHAISWAGNEPTLC
jgi:hypothetical protein